MPSDEHSKKQYANVIVCTHNDTTVEITGEVSAETFELHRKKTLAKAQQNFELPGFRKGHVPIEMISSHTQTKQLLEDSAYGALEEVYPDILKEYAVESISLPQISFTKLAFGNPLGFSLRVAVTPTIELPQYKKIAKEILSAKKVVEVTDADIDELVKKVRAIRKESTEEPFSLTDDYVKKLGTFDNVHDFREKMRESIRKEREVNIRREQREKIADELVSKTKCIISQLPVDDELYRLLERLDQELEKKNVSSDAYFKKIGKAEKQFIEEQRTAIECQLKMKYILKKIAVIEKIAPSEKEIDEEFRVMAAHYKNIDAEKLRHYIIEMLTNEKTLLFLEGEKYN